MTNFMVYIHIYAYHFHIRMIFIYIYIIITDKWLGPCGLHKIDCSSFDARPADVVLYAYDHIKTYVELPEVGSDLSQEHDQELPP
jgi:hypothetical protein